VGSGGPVDTVVVQCSNPLHPTVHVPPVHYVVDVDSAHADRSTHARSVASPVAPQKPARLVRLRNTFESVSVLINFPTAYNRLTRVILSYCVSAVLCRMVFGHPWTGCSCWRRICLQGIHRNPPAWLPRSSRDRGHRVIVTLGSLLQAH
jgi:hypothetical protein